MEVSKCWKIVEFLKFSFKIKKCKTFYEAQTASRLKEIIQLHSTYLPPDKTLLFFWNKKFSYGDIQTFGFKVLQECGSWASRNGETKQKHV